jgi:hypothetical protein
MTGWLLIAGGLLLAAGDAGDDVLQWWWLALLSLLVGAAWNWIASRSGGWLADDETSARLAAVDHDLEGRGL